MLLRTIFSEQDYKLKTDELERICRDPRSLNDSESIQLAISTLKNSKRAMLESSVYALQEGDALLNRLRLLWNHATLDSRPGFIKKSASLAIGRVSLKNIFFFLTKIFLTAFLGRSK